jgi:prophage regulatory protein
MRYIRFKELKTLVPLGRTTIWRMEQEGRFPRSRRIGKSAKAWLETEVLSWMQERAGDQGKGQAVSGVTGHRESLIGGARLRKAETD